MKTKEQKLKAVTDDIRAKLPRLMELSDGCEFISEDIKYQVILDLEKWVLTFDGNNIDKIHCDYIKDTRSKIIGKEPMLNDVLEWLELIQPKSSWSSYAITMDGRLIDVFAEITICKIDLSKPYLKDQSEKLINFLYELL